MSTRYFFVEAIDVLMLRGNRSFGDAGQHGEALIPSWPSLFAGAFRSAMLAGDAWTPASLPPGWLAGCGRTMLAWSPSKHSAAPKASTTSCWGIGNLVKR